MRRLRATRGRKLDITKTYTTAKHEKDSCMPCFSFNEETLFCKRFMCSCGAALINERLCGPDRKGRMTMDDI